MVQQSLNEWNSNMRNKFSSSWISRLDKCISKWDDRVTFPGYCCVLYNPWPFVNEYNTITFRRRSKLYCIELVKRRDGPKEGHVKEYSE